jgi:hypothetical protein
LDWAKAIERNSAALIAIVAALFKMLRGEDERLPLRLHRAVLRVLRPAESAMRRLIVIAARGLVVKLAPARQMPKRPAIAKKRKGGAARVSFQLFDPRKRFAYQRRRRRLNPRVFVISFDPRVAAMRPAWQPAPQPAPRVDEDGRVSALPLTRRLNALKLALDDLPGQAKRFVQWRARRERQQAQQPVFISPLRPGHPPGYRAKPRHDVDHVLRECHDLAYYALEFDTS